MPETRPFLILDCYLDRTGGAHNLLPLLEGEQCEVVRVAHEALPSTTQGFAGLVVNGSAASILEPPAWVEGLCELLRDAYRRSTPTLGICFGHQAIARAIGGERAVRRSQCSELGWVEIECCGRDELIAGFPTRFHCFVSHFDEVAPDLPQLEVFARSEHCAVHGFAVRGRPMWAVQFHPEMDPAESERLLRSSLPRHPHLGVDPERLLQAAVDARPLGNRLMANFRRLARTALSALSRGSGRQSGPTELYI